MRVLLTGATGFLGSHVLTALVKRNHQVTALARSVPEKRSPGVRYLAGNILHDGLDLAEPPEVDYVVHCAGFVSFSDKERSRLWKTNVDGTRRVAELALRLHVPFCHISTAYVCGDYRGHICPEQLVLGQKHHNIYEISKWSAEQMLYALREDGLRLTIIRPSIIVGDAQVKGIPPLAGYYVAVRAFDAAKRFLERKLALPPVEVRIRFRGNADATLNIIPADMAAAQIADIVSWREQGAFHVVNRRPPTIGRLAQAISDVVGAQFVPAGEGFPRNPAERLVHNMIAGILPYMQGEPVFDTVSTDRIAHSACDGVDDVFLRATTRHFLNWETPGSD